MTTLSPDQLHALVQKVTHNALVASYSATNSGGKATVKIGPGIMTEGSTIQGVPVGKSAAFHNGRITEQTLPFNEWAVRNVTAVAIMLAESRGQTDARCYNRKGADGKVHCSPTPPADADRGYDRGVWQWNSKAWAVIPDTAADNPELATELAWLATDGFRDFGPWKGSLGLDPKSEPWQTSRKAWEAAFGPVDPKGVLGLPGEETVLNVAQNAATGLVGQILDWPAALGRLLSSLISGSFWLRVGTGALGVAFIVGALVLFVTQTKTAQTIGKAAL